MPYIKQDMRDKLASSLDLVTNEIVEHDEYDDDPMRLYAYVIYCISVDFIGEVRYSKINDVCGALECCLLELYRRRKGFYQGRDISTIEYCYVKVASLDKAIDFLVDAAKSIDGFEDSRAGILNYIITVIINEGLDRGYDGHPDLRDMVNIIDFVKREIYDNIAAPYENQKAYENGDVY